MALPDDVTVVTLTGTYVDELGQPASGSLTFIPSVGTLRDPAHDVTIKLNQQRVELTVGGLLSVALLATDDPDLVPVGFHYDVVERIDGYAQRSWILQLPHTITVIDVADIPSSVDPSLPVYPAPVFAVTSVVGHIGDVTGAHILADPTVDAALDAKADDADLAALTTIVDTKANSTDLATLVPYSGATGDVNLGANSLRGENVNVNEGSLTDPTITDLGGLQISVTSTDCLIRSDAIYGTDGWLYRATVPAATLALTDDAVNHLHVAWNGGSPVYAVTTDRAIMNLSNVLPVARLLVQGGAVHSKLTFGFMGRSAAIRWLLREVRITDPVGGVAESGLTLSESPTRVVNIAAGKAWFVLNYLTLDAVTQGGMGVTSFLVHHTGGVWTKTPITQYNNTQYDNGANLVTLTNNRYAVNWIYRSFANGEILIVLGTGDHLAPAAIDSTIPSVPDYLNEFYYMCGRIIVQKGSGTAYRIENRSTTPFGISPIVDHNDLIGLQGGTTDEYYHLTAAELALVGTTPSGLVPYTGATGDVDLGANSLYADNVPFTEGTLSDPTITDATGLTISIASCQAMIRSDPLWGGDEKLYRVTVPANAMLAVTDNAVNYIYINWNSGSPIYMAATDKYVINGSDKLPVARVAMKSGSIEHQIAYAHIARGSATRNYLRIMLIRGIGGIERESGLAISESGTRVVTIASGNVWIGLNRISLSAITNGVGGAILRLWYHSGGVWTEAALTGYNNTQYDNGTDLVTLTSNRYAVNWVYRNVTSGEIDIVLGLGDYTLAQAEASTRPPIPEVMSAFYTFCGRIIVQRNAATAYAIENVVANAFNQAAVSSHNDLTGLQGGTTGQLYHLTAAQHAAYGVATSITPGTPASGSAPGTAGQILYDADYLYVCTATNTWKYVSLISF